MEKNADILDTNKTGEQDLVQPTYENTVLKVLPKTPHTAMSPEAMRQKNNFSRDQRCGYRWPKADEPSNPSIV